MTSLGGDARKSTSDGLTPRRRQVKSHLDFSPAIADPPLVGAKVVGDMLKSLRTVAVLATLGLTATMAPAQAGQQELDLLLSYLGNWQGQGALVGGQEPEPFKCRLSVTKGNQSKVNYAGRCSLVNMNLSVSGTIAYDDAARHYKAAMSSNAGFTGIAVGRQKGDAISFDLAERQTDRGGNDVRIGSVLTLTGDQITVAFEVEFNSSGQVLTATVPFSK
jgi:hypothetical protein